MMPSVQILTSILSIVGEAIGLELRTSGDRPYLRTQIYTGFMYIGAALCAGLLRVWKARRVGKLEATTPTDAIDDAYFKMRNMRLWKRV